MPDFINVPYSYRIEVARGDKAGRVGFIESFGKVRGPHGVAVGVKGSAIAGFLRHGTRHRVGSATTDRWTYWVIPMKSHFFYVRSGNNNGGGTRDRVYAFGLAASRAVANSRGTTQGGCY